MAETRCVLAFGSNLGDSGETFRMAFARLEKGGFKLEKVSSFLQTKPVGCEPGAPDFLNGVLTGFWSGTPEELLVLCQSIEVALGRPSDHPKNHSRTLDLDIILFGQETRNTPELEIPHPRAAAREFVWKPLLEIAPELLSALTQGMA